MKYVTICIDWTVLGHIAKVIKSNNIFLSKSTRCTILKFILFWKNTQINLRYCVSGWFTKKYITMHVPTNVKVTILFHQFC